MGRTNRRVERRTPKSKKPKIYKIKKWEDGVEPRRLAVKDVWWDIILPLCEDKLAVRSVCKNWHRWYWERVQTFHVIGWQNLCHSLYPNEIKSLTVHDWPTRKVRKEVKLYPNLKKVYFILYIGWRRPYKLEDHKTFDISELKEWLRGIAPNHCLYHSSTCICGKNENEVRTLVYKGANV